MSDVIRASGFDNFRQALADATDEQVTVAPIEADNFADLRMKLDIATDEQLTVTAEHWRDRTGEIAAEYRLFVQAEITHRQATAALVAAMAPPTRWEAQR